MNDVSIREATPEDWESWRTIRLRSLLHDPDAFGSTYEHEAGFDEATWRSRLGGESGPAVLATVASAPVGMGAGWLYEPGHLMVVAMWTEPAWRGHGVGRRVLDEVVGWARARGLRPDLWVADVNPDARRLYERYGFRADGATEPLREGSTLSKSRLVLSGPPT
jgi:GNAT superfamily N-acetyltransferase